MCGITGLVHFDGRKTDIETLIRMNRSLAHRGPDEEGYFINKAADASLRENAQVPLRTLNNGYVRGRNHNKTSVGFGHRRLSIIDLATGQQPLSNEDGTIWISFNGEIYNFQEIKQELLAKGHVFQTNSDTETIVHAYEEWGTKSVERLRGMFAFAIWDENQQQLFLARDRVGKKPLYYAHDDKQFVFGSEIKAVLAAKDMDRSIDLTALSDYFSLLYVPAPKTIFNSIKKLPAAHYAVVDHTGMTVSRYWDLCFEPEQNTSENKIMENLVEILTESTQMRMISEVPLGAFLSGGVDSSAIVALMSGVSPEPVVTNSISFSEAAYNEAEYARQVASLFNTSHNEFHVTPEAIPIIEKLAWHYDEPFADSSAVPTYYVSKMAREKVTVSLSGDGGDENFAGYRRYYMDARENLVRNMVPELFRQPLFGFLGKLYPKADYLPQIFRGKAFLSNVARDPLEAYYFSMCAVHDMDKPDYFNTETMKELKGYHTVDFFRAIYDNAPAPDHLSRIQYLDIQTYLCDDILTKVDRASMAVSLEVRCPILDHVFMENAAKIPSRLKLKGLEGKHIFKKALKKHLPHDILYRKKMGFGVPILEWLRKDLNTYSKNLVLGGDASQQYLNITYLEKIWNEHQKGMRNWSTQLWAIMMFNLWYQKFKGI
ncbi:asparagine synthase (glutamine-hydrolyzing) [Desulfobacter postgatei]|uniref:asparagine synthase (glutamine-hydrolyzing) n=1 Tax=Desulfobacter postgatei 2ac9 TaxID=879212 RepID=I5B256_9BACT|nr:asparagine synthase (glutamine-hydrolyzing) [Desulfobacter postgatei]EIM63569.1 asparagine synthase, glutamine-hydrolyzing [Desulfobacter postgatei 2ac9]